MTACPIKVPPAQTSKNAWHTRALPRDEADAKLSSESLSRKGMDGSPGGLEENCSDSVGIVADRTIGTVLAKTPLPPTLDSDSAACTSERWPWTPAALPLGSL